MLGIAKAEEASLRPLSQRIEKFQRMRDDAQDAKKRAAATPHARKSTVVVPAGEPLVLDAKLKLPPLAFMSKQGRLIA
jgi:hypothetical protein